MAPLWRLSATGNNSPRRSAKVDELIRKIQSLARHELGAGTPERIVGGNVGTRRGNHPQELARNLRETRTAEGFDDTYASPVAGFAESGRCHESASRAAA